MHIFVVGERVQHCCCNSYFSRKVNISNFDLLIINFRTNVMYECNVNSNDSQNIYICMRIFVVDERVQRCSLQFVFSMKINILTSIC